MKNIIESKDRDLKVLQEKYFKIESMTDNNELKKLYNDEINEKEKYKRKMEKLEGILISRSSQDSSPKEKNLLEKTEKLALEVCDLKKIEERYKMLSREFDRINQVSLIKKYK